MLKKGCLWLIVLYRRWLSLFLPHCCRFYPSCSEYAYQAIEKYGVFRGGQLSFCRLFRCGPWCPGGYDPLK